MRAFFRVVLLVLVLMSVALVSALTAMRFAIHGRQVAVPKFVGMSLGQAGAVAQDNGLLLTSDDRYYSAEVPEGKVMSQSPAPGTEVRRGWRVRLAESLGPQRVEIPNVGGQSVRAAEINLGRRGLEPGTVAIAHLPGLPVDQVVAQDPPPSAGGVTSPKVSLLVSAANDAGGAYVMPDFTGQTLAEAKIAVEDAGFKMAPATLSLALTNGSSPKSKHAAASDLIVRQTPVAGQKIEAGATISFQVAKP